MTLSLILLYLFTFLIYQLSSQGIDIEDTILHCESDPCVLIPKSFHKTGVCLSKQNNCILYCISPDQCKNFLLYSGSLNTIIYCTQIESCKNATFNIGNVPQITNISSLIYEELEITNKDFISEKSKLIVNCDGKNSCDNLKLNIYGYFSENIELNGLNYQSLINAIINSNIDIQQILTINCGNVQQQSCKNIDINCDNGKCICMGQSCPINAMIPTNPPSPTPQPTILPECKNIQFTQSNDPRILTCDGKSIGQGPCILIPTEIHETVICNIAHETCIIDCKDKRQCWHGLTIYSGAKNTIIYCSNEESCKNAKFYIGELKYGNDMPDGYNKCDFYGVKHSLKIDCNSESSCENAIINIDGEFTDSIHIDALGEETLLQTELNINTYLSTPNIELICGTYISLSCDGLVYNCIRGNCKCNGETCPKIITSSPTPAPTLITVQPTSINPTKHTREPTGTRIPTMITLHPSYTPTSTPTGRTVDVYPNGDQTVYCTNDVDYCIINCIKPQSCKVAQDGLVVYSAAKYTFIKCTNEDACTEAKFYIGIPKKIPKSYLLKDFTGIMNELIIDCTGKASCQSVKIEIYGNIKNGAIINANNFDSFEDGKFECYLTNFEKPCIVNCAIERELESCEMTTLECKGNCICNGDSCNGAKIDFSQYTTTGKPTIITYNPTLIPTMPTPYPSMPTLYEHPLLDGDNNIHVNNHVFTTNNSLGIYHYALLAMTIAMLISICVCCIMRQTRKRSLERKKNGLLTMEQLSNKSQISTTLQNNGDYIDYGSNHITTNYNQKKSTIGHATTLNESDVESTEL